MYYRLGIVCACAAGVAGSSYVLGLDRVPEEATRFAAALSSIDALREYTDGMDKWRVDMYSLVTFLQSEDSSEWIRTHRSHVGSEVGAAFDMIVSILKQADKKYHFDNACMPPLDKYFGKRLDANQIKFIASLYTLDNELSEDDLSILSQVEDYEKVFGPIIAKVESEDSTSDSCLDQTRLRRVATILTAEENRFHRVLGVPHGKLGVDAATGRAVVTRHVSEIQLHLDFESLYKAMKKFETSRSAKAQPNVSPLFTFVWYYSPETRCQAYARIISGMTSSVEYEDFIASFAGTDLLDEGVWAAICALNASDDFQSVREKRFKLFQHRSEIVRTAVAFMDHDAYPNFRGLLREVNLFPHSGTDASILEVPAAYGYAFIHDEVSYSMVLSREYKAIAEAYIAIGIDPILYSNLWDASMKDWIASLTGGSFNYDFMEYVTRNPFVLASAVIGADCASLVAIGLIPTAERCEALKTMRPDSLVRALVAALAGIKHWSTSDAMLMALAAVHP